MIRPDDDHGFDLVGFVERTLGDGDRERVTRHLETCPRCAEQVRNLDAGLDAARSLRGSIDDAADDLVARTLDRIAVERASVALPAVHRDPAGRTRAAGPRLQLVGALVLAIGLGWAVGWASRAGAGRADPEQDFAETPAALRSEALEAPTHALLLLAPGPLRGSRNERLDAYQRWAAELREADRLVLAEALTADGGWIGDDDGPSSAARQSAADEAFGSLLGFYFIRVPDDATALEIARNSPHRGFGGEILVRRIYPTPRAEP